MSNGIEERRTGVRRAMVPEMERHSVGSGAMTPRIAVPLNVERSESTWRWATITRNRVTPERMQQRPMATTFARGTLVYAVRQPMWKAPGK